VAEAWQGEGDVPVVELVVLTADVLDDAVVDALVDAVVDDAEEEVVERQAAQKVEKRDTVALVAAD